MHILKLLFIFYLDEMNFLIINSREPKNILDNLTDKKLIIYLD